MSHRPPHNRPRALPSSARSQPPHAAAAPPWQSPPSPAAIASSRTPAEGPTRPGMADGDGHQPMSPGPSSPATAQTASKAKTHFGGKPIGNEGVLVPTEAGAPRHPQLMSDV